MKKRNDEKTIQALFESEKHWIDVVNRFDPKVEDRFEWFEANCKADKCAICNLGLCNECLLYDERGSACFETWKEAHKAAKKGTLQKHHLEAVLKHITQICDLHRDKPTS